MIKKNTFFILGTILILSRSSIAFALPLREMGADDARDQINMMSEKSLQGQDMHEMTFACGTDLNHFNLSNANLKNISVEQDRARCAVSLSGADLSGADLRGADLRMFTHLEEASSLKGAVYNRFTKFPIGFDPVENGLVLVGAHYSPKKKTKEQEDIDRVNKLIADFDKIDPEMKRSLAIQADAKIAEIKDVQAKKVYEINTDTDSTELNGVPVK